MIRHKILTALGAAATVIALLAVGLPIALAQLPENDDFGFATPISGLPSEQVFTLYTTEATTAGDDPYPSCYSPGREASVWFSVTPGQNMRIDAHTYYSSYSTIVSVYTGSGDVLSEVACGFSFVTFNATAGQTYYFMVGGYPSGYPGGTGGYLDFRVVGFVPPANDNFSDAEQFTSLPFDANVDITFATLEGGEPTLICDGWADLDKTIWYAFTPNTNGSITARVSTWFPTVLNAYTGNSLASLTNIGCRVYGGQLTLLVDAGTTYYFQAGSLSGYSGSLQFHIEVTPPPIASFSFNPYDPSVFDTVQFYDNSNDPGGVGIQSQAWDFGDGATATGCCPTHRYATDGDYTVQLTVTTPDGRTGSTSQTVRVSTHDVAITKFSAPQSASAGQTRHIVVGINSRRYVETVQVQLFKSVPGGFQWVGTLEQQVPVRSGNRTTDFDFSYTFTSADASVGKVTFKAVATMVNARDALPADNEAIASPTKVNR